MTNDDIKKLLGGYATNTLTEEERKALFEAALEDQELFDALQQDQPLKELLASPVTRAQVAQALDHSSTKPRAWWSHWWTWGGAAGALAAGVFVVVMMRSNAPQVNQQIASVETASQPNPAASAEPAAPPPPPQSAPRRRDEDRAAAKPRSYTANGSFDRGASGGRQAESKTEAGAGKDTKEEDRVKDQPTTAAAPPPPPPAVASSGAPVQQAQQAPSTPSPSQEQVRNQVQAFRDQERAAAPKSVVPAGAIGGFVSASVRAPSGLRYSLIKRDAAGAYVPIAAEALQAGDSVRISVIPAVQGYLTLSVLDSSGDWKSVYPPPGQTLSVKPNTTYSLPDSNIEVQPKDQKFRLTLVPVLEQNGAANAELSSGERNLDKAKKAKVAPESALRKQAPIIGQPLVLDVTISPKPTR